MKTVSPHTQDVDYEAELILSTLLESHAGAAAAEAAAVAPQRRDVRTPGDIGVDSPLAVDGSGGGRLGGGRAGELGLSPAPGLTGRTFPGATVARPGSAGAGAASGVGAGPSRFGQEAQQQGGEQQQPPYFQQQQYQQQQEQPPPRQQEQYAAQRQRLPSGLVDDPTVWAATTGEGPPGQGQSVLHPLGGDAGPFVREQVRGLASETRLACTNVADGNF